MPILESTLSKTFWIDYVSFQLSVAKIHITFLHLQMTRMPGTLTKTLCWASLCQVDAFWVKIVYHSFLAYAVNICKQLSALHVYYCTCLGTNKDPAPLPMSWLVVVLRLEFFQKVLAVTCTFPIALPEESDGHPQCFNFSSQARTPRRSMIMVSSLCSTLWVSAVPLACVSMTGNENARNWWQLHQTLCLKVYVSLPWGEALWLQWRGLCIQDLHHLIF